MKLKKLYPARVAVLCLTALFTACSPVSTKRETPAPVDDRTAQSGTKKKIQTASFVQKSRATESLIQKADRYSQEKRYPQAAALLERALRIRSRDAEIWHKLANVRYQQGHYVQAESMAKKSLSLAHGSRQMKMQNWELIVRIRQKQGDATGVVSALKRLDALRNQVD
jgi:tetratricopeptide (TPR) repeat protein